MSSLNGKWKGKFSYDAEFDDNNTEHYFEMTLQVDEEDDISGEIRDLRAEEGFPGPAKITGFIDGEDISFIKQYPHLFLLNEKREVIIDKTKPHPEIHYHGSITEEGISGEWDMEAHVLFKVGEYHSQMLFGSWELKKIAD